jgi:ABC-type transport system involved in multi-copper enzyme maturation permease subunit
VIGRIYAVALNTFREAIRHRILWGILAMVVAFNLFAIVLGELSLHEEARIARDVGLGGLSLFGAFTAIYLGVSLLYGEINKKTIYSIISKPIDRWEFVLGKYAGMATTLSALVALFGVAMAALLWWQDVAFSAAMIKAIVLAYMEVLIVAAMAVFFSSFSTPFLSGIFTFAMFFFGRVTPEMRSFADRGDWMGFLCRRALEILPDLHLYSVSGSLLDGDWVSVHGDFVSWGYVGTSLLFGLLYIAALLMLAIVIFSRRDFV